LRNSEHFVSTKEGRVTMMRLLAFSVLCGTLFFGFSVGEAEAAKKSAKGPPRCMEAVVPKCNAPQFFFCQKKNKCGACAKWTCRLPGPPRV
jgi:hypothetical protein